MTVTSPTGGFRIAEGYVEITTRVSRSDIRDAGRAAAADFERSAAPEFRDAGERSGRGFTETFTRRTETAFRDSRGRFTRGAEDVFGGAGDRSGRSFGSEFRRATRTVFADLGSKATDAFKKILPDASQIAGFLKAGIKPVLMLVTGLQYIPPILSAIAGGLAALPALLTGAVGAIGVLGLGFHGVGAAISQVLGGKRGGGGGGAAIDQVASAERRLAQAQRQAADAQLNLNDAREQAAKDLIDLNMQLNRARLDEQSASLAVLEAQRNLLLARANTSDPYAVARAQLAYREAQQSLVEAKAHTQDLAEANDKAADAGVEGSDRVKQALEQQQNAIDALKDSEDALAQARKGSGGGGLKDALAGLAPSARAFVLEIGKLKPKFHELQQTVQQNLFAGWDKSLDKLANTWLPHLKSGLGGLATSFNGFGKHFAEAFSQKSVTDGFDAVMKGLSDFVTDLGPHLPGLADAFGKLAKAAAPFLKALGGDFIKGIDKFSRFIDKADKNGSLEKFFKDAATNAHDLFIDIKDIGKIVADALGLLLGDNPREGEKKRPLQQLHDDLKSIDDWLNSDEGKDTFHLIAALLDGVATAARWAVKGIGWLVDKFGDWYRWMDKISGKAKDFKDGLVNAFLGVSSTIGGIMDNLSSRVSSALNRIRDAAKDAFNWTSKVPGASYLANLLPFRHGGVHMAAAGLTTFGQGAFYPKPVFGIAEKGTGGELFMPRFGEKTRQQMLAGVAAGFAGGSFTPGTQQHGSPKATISTGPLQPVVIQIGDQPVVKMVLGIVGGNPTVVSASAHSGDRVSNHTNTGRRRG